MEKVAKKLLDENKISQDEYESVKGMTKEAFLGMLFKKIPKMNEAGKIIGESIGFSDLAEKIKQGAQVASLLGIAGLVGSQAVGKAKSAIDSQTAYGKMFEKMPNLSEYPEDQVRDFYSVVKTFSPKAASNPLVAGALVNKMLQFGGVDHKLVQDIANIEGDKRDFIGDLASRAGQSFIGLDY